MPDPLTNPLGPLLPLVLALGLGALRWVPALILVPIFAPHALSRIARIAVALALALPIVPGLLPAIAARAPSPDLALGLAAKECAIGLLLATVLAVPLWAVESAGTCLDYQRGANAQALDPSASPDASVFGALFKHASCVYLIHAGALHALVAVVYASFAVWPPLAWLPALDSGTWAAIEPLLTAMMRLAVLLALPYLLALVLVEVCFAVLSRAAPRFPAYVAALPFKSVLAVLVVALSLPALFDALAQATFAHAEAALHLLERMRADRP
jgi:type III secretion protein T